MSATWAKQIRVLSCSWSSRSLSNLPPIYPQPPSCSQAGKATVKSPSTRNSDAQVSPTSDNLFLFFIIHIGWSVFLMSIKWFPVLAGKHFAGLNVTEMWLVTENTVGASCTCRSSWLTFFITRLNVVVDWCRWNEVRDLSGFHLHNLGCNCWRGLKITQCTINTYKKGWYFINLPGEIKLGRWYHKWAKYKWKKQWIIIFHTTGVIK